MFLGILIKIKAKIGYLQAKKHIIKQQIKNFCSFVSFTHAYILK